MPLADVFSLLVLGQGKSGLDVARWALAHPERVSATTVYGGGSSEPNDATRALEAQGVSVLLDDRRQASPGVKFKDAELIGVPTIVVLGRGLAQGVIEVKDRRSGERREVAVDAAVQEILAEIGRA